MPVVAYSEAIADEICERLSVGESLRSICALEHMPSRPTVRKWAYDDYRGFGARYERARDLGIQDMEDELLEICDDARNDWMARRAADGRMEMVPNQEHIQRSRLRAEMRRWLMSQRSPSHYGKRVKSDDENTSKTIVVMNPPTTAREE